MSFKSLPPRLQLVGDDPGVSRYAALATALRTAWKLSIKRSLK